MKVEDLFNQPNIVDLSFFNFRNAITAAYFANRDFEILRINENLEMVVGTILTTINHGDTIVLGDWPAALKVFLTYCVPYCVTTWGAVIGKRAQWRRDFGG